MRYGFMRLLLKLLPKNLLSYLTGRLAELRLPGFLGPLSVRWFAGRYGINMDEAEMAIDSYPTIAALFTRRLKVGCRTIGSGLVSPVDGLLRSCDFIGRGRIEQVKDRDYSVSELVGGSQYASRFKEGFYFNLYLSPSDYHRVHAPLSGTVIGISYIPGTLWPVNDWSLRRIDRLFTVNERVVTYLQGDYGVVAVVMVGATNVGKITLSFTTCLTNQRPFALKAGLRTPVHCFFDLPVYLRCGDELGVFHLGSTVIVLCEREVVTPRMQPGLGLNMPVKMGESLGNLRAGTW